MLSSDIFRVIADKLPTTDVANLSIAINDRTIIDDRKKKDYERIFEKTMQELWFARMVFYHRMWRTRGFWDPVKPDIFCMEDSFKWIDLRYIFQKWKPALNRNILHLMTKIFDEYIVVVVELHFPAGSLGRNQKFKCGFDVVFSSHKIDIDSYAPKNAPIITAMNDAYRYQCSQTGMSTNSPDIIWDNIVSHENTLGLFESKLGPEWKMEPGIYHTLIDDIKYRVNLYNGTITIGDDFDSHISIKLSNPTRFSSSLRMSRNVVKAALRMGLPLTIPHVLKINIKMNGNTDTFYTWDELIGVSGMSAAKLRKMAETTGYREYYINFDAHTYKRKPISFTL